MQISGLTPGVPGRTRPILAPRSLGSTSVSAATRLKLGEMPGWFARQNPYLAGRAKPAR